jgi:pyruvate/2-oxoacid:ferredoxin oxidoreductase alpha subunit
MPSGRDPFESGGIMKELLEGSHAVAEAVARCRVQVIAAYPITPQTHISERLAELTASCALPSRFIMVESEHSAMAACIGAALTGVRVFTATSSHGLVLMHELLHWAGGGRLPIVMVNVNRALGAPWNIWADQSDSLSQRDTGWIQFYCETSQEAVDTVILAYKIAEQAQLPVMVMMDAFIVSHINEPVEIPTAEQVDAFLPSRKAPFKLDVQDPFAYGLVTGPDHYMEVRHAVQEAMTQALEITRREFQAFKLHFGRAYEPVETYRVDGADTVLVMAGALAGVCKDAIDMLWNEGKKVGMAKIKVFRPLPVVDIRQIVGDRKTVVVVDRNLSPGTGGIFAQEIRSCLSGLPQRPNIIGAVAGLGGRDVTEDDLFELANRALAGKLEEDKIEWINLRPKN